MAWEQGTVLDTDANHKRIVVLIESKGITPSYALFDNLYDGLPSAKVEGHTAVLHRLLPQVGTAVVAVERIANPVVPTRRMRSAVATEYLLRQPIEPTRSERRTKGPSLWAGAGLAIGACAMTACTLPHAPPLGQSPPAIPSAGSRLVVQAQQHRTGFWELVPCAEGQCQRPTPKTLAGFQTSAAGVPVALPVQVGGTAIESGPKLDAAGGEARHVSSGIPVRSVFFRTGSSVPDSSQTAAIQSLAPELARSKKIIVIGCTDSTGTRATNERLAERRAAALRAQLVRLGIAKEKIEIQIDLSGDGNLPGVGVTGTTPGDVNARARRSDIAIV